MHSLSRSKLFGEQKFFEKISFFPIFRTLSAKTTDVLAKTSRQNAQYCNLRVHCGNYGLNNSFEKKSSFSDNIRNFSSFLDEKFQRACRKCIQLIHMKLLKKFNFLSKFFSILQQLIEKLSVFCQNFLGRVVKPALFLSIGTH